MQNKQEGRVAQVDVSEDPTGVRSAVSDQEKAARVDLAAAHRLADIFGWTNLIYNHITLRSEEHTSELQSLMRISYAVFCLKKKNKKKRKNTIRHIDKKQTLSKQEYKMRET